MIEQIKHLLAIPDTPRYNIKAVVQDTQVNISTLRAWEQRYGIPRPKRSTHGHRLYSQRDMAIIKWLKQCTESGLAISQAVNLLREHAHPDEVEEPVHHESGETIMSMGLADLRYRLFEALRHSQIRQAHLVLNTAAMVFPLERIILEVFQPILHSVGELWASGEICTAEEHLITNFIRQRLLALSQVYAPFAHGPRLVCGCVPNDQHEISMLMFSLLMEKRGWEVLYLGQSVATEGIRAYLSHLSPALVCLSASMVEYVSGIVEMGQIIHSLNDRCLQLLYSGRVFVDYPELQNRFPGIYLGNDLLAAVETANNLGEQVDKERWLSITSFAERYGAGLPL